MNGLELVDICCPNCGEPIELTVDCSVVEQRYSEDCAVCCRPICLRVSIDANGCPRIEVSREDEV